MLSATPTPPPPAQIDSPIYSQKDLLGYLSSLPRDVLASLYKDTWSEYACQAVFRALPSQARVYVLRAIAGQPVSDSSFAWKGNVREHDRAISSLLQLQIFEVAQVEGARKVAGAGSATYKISESFAKGIKQALINEEVKAQQAPVASWNYDKTEDTAADRWNNVLTYLVFSSDGVLSGNGKEEKEEPSKRSSQKDRPNIKRARMSASPVPSAQQVSIDGVIQTALKELGFVTDGEDRGQHITSTGYEFMLKDVFEQVWIVVQHFITKLGAGPQSQLLRFLFRISFLSPGAELAVGDDSLSKEAISFLKACGVLVDNGYGKISVSSLGIHTIFPPSSQKKLMAKVDDTSVNQTNASADVIQASSRRNRQLGLSGMRIIVETTFKVFCYTNSPMHSQMLQLFCQVETRLPNLVVAMITRESVSEAYKKGISDEQLISFLRQNAHPITHTTRRNILPDNVTDQIRLWKRELERVQVAYGRLMIMEKHPAYYDRLIENREFMLYVQWKDDAGKRMFVVNEGTQMFRQLRAAWDERTKTFQNLPGM